MLNKLTDIQSYNNVEHSNVAINTTGLSVAVIQSLFSVRTRLVAIPYFLLYHTQHNPDIQSLLNQTVDDPKRNLKKHLESKIQIQGFEDTQFNPNTRYRTRPNSRWAG